MYQELLDLAVENKSSTTEMNCQQMEDNGMPGNFHPHHIKDDDFFLWQPQMCIKRLHILNIGTHFLNLQVNVLWLPGK